MTLALCRWWACILPCLAACLWLGCSVVQAASPIEKDLRAFASKSWKPLSPVHSSSMVAVSQKRWELYGEDHGRGYAAVARENETTPVGQSGMQILCTAALARKYETLLVDHLSQKKMESLISTEFVRLAMVETYFGSIRWLGYNRQDGVEFAACSTALDDVKPVDIEKHWDRYLATASYKVALSLIKQGRQETALSLLKNTRSDMGVYNNALGFIIPLLAEKDQASAIRLEQDFVDPKRMNDPEALLFLVRYRRIRGDSVGAKSLLDRCLQIDPRSRLCREEQASLQSIGTSIGEAPDLSYDSFFTQ